MKTYKTGMHPFVHTPESVRRMGVMSSYLADLGAPPSASLAYGEMYEKAIGNTNWGGMLANGPDKLSPVPGGVGDCVICDDLRDISLWTALGTGPLYVPTTPDAIALYSASTGFNVADPNETDNGADPITNAKFMQQYGFKGHKLDGWAPVNIANSNHLRWSIQIYGAVKYCLNLPDFAEDQFDTKGYWDFTKQPYKIVGGHDVMGMQYDVDGKLWIATWGKLIYMTPAFATQFVTGIIAPYSHEFITMTGASPAKFYPQQMTQDLTLVSN